MGNPLDRGSGYCPQVTKVVGGKGASAVCVIVEKSADWKRGRRLLSLACQGLAGWYEEETGQCFRLDGTPCRLGEVPQVVSALGRELAAADWRRGDVAGKSLPIGGVISPAGTFNVPTLDPLGDPAGWVSPPQGRPPTVSPSQPLHRLPARALILPMHGRPPRV